jgi:hypothetical protein
MLNIIYNSTSRKARLGEVVGMMIGSGRYVVDHFPMTIFRE